MQAAVIQTLARFGRLDELVANAGIGLRGSLVEAAWRDLEALLRTNIEGVLHSIRAAVPALRASGGGQIVLVSSVASQTAAPYTAAYGANKAFVSSLARSLNLELEPDNITVTDLIVGVTDPEFQHNRLGATEIDASATKLPSMTPEQVAEGIVKATERRAKTVVLRPFDRLILLANLIAPGLIGGRRSNATRPTKLKAFRCRGGAAHCAHTRRPWRLAVQS